MKDLVALLQRQVMDLRKELRTKPITTARSASMPPSAVIETVMQTAHGFTVGQVVRLTGAGSYALAKADTPTNAKAVGVVAFVQNVNTFSVVTSGFMGGLSGLTAGASYYLSDTVAGAVTTTPPTITVAIYIAKSASVALVGISSPNSISTGAVAALTAQIFQPGHGFVLGDIVGSTPAGLWFKVTADDYVNLNAMAIVSTVIDSNNAILTLEGLALGVLSGISLGVRYYLDPTTPGAVTPTKPMGNSVQVLTCANGTAGGTDGTDVIIHPFHAMGFANDTGLVVYQPGHGLQIGSALIVDNTGVYQLAQATSIIDANVIGLVGEVRDLDHFTLVSEGFIANPATPPYLVGAPFTPGVPYYLSPTTPGDNTSTEPVAFATKLFTYIDAMGIYVQIEHASDFPDAIGFAVNEPGHGFVVGEVLRISGADTYTRAKADSTQNAEVAGVVGAVLGVDDFFLITSGRIKGLSSLVDGTFYYLSDTVSGAVVTTPPADHVVQIYEATNTTDAIVNIRPTPIVTAISQVVTQFAHGFVVGDVLRGSTPGAYTKAQADTPTHALALGVVSEVIDSDTFVMVMAGLISGLSGLTTGAPYYLDPTTPGAVTFTAPGSNVVAIYEAISTTQAIVKIVLAPTSSGASAFKTFSRKTASSGTFTVPAGVFRIRVRLVGDGGGGGGSYNTLSLFGFVALTSGGSPNQRIDVEGLGGGGGSGAILIIEFDVNPGDTITWTIGSGGTAGVAGSPPTAATDGSGTSITYATNTATAGGGKFGAGGGPSNGGDGGKGGTTSNSIVGSTTLPATTVISISSNGENGGTHHSGIVVGMGKRGKGARCFAEGSTPIGDGGDGGSAGNNGVAGRPGEIVFFY